MDFASIITIIIGIAVIIFIIKFIVSPLIKALTGIIAFIAVIYILQHFLNFDVIGMVLKFFNK